MPDWFLALSPREQRKQIRRWRYHRMYQRRTFGDRWLVRMLFRVGLL